jgi:hypothetical protein
MPRIKEPEEKEDKEASKENDSPSLSIPPPLHLIKKHFFFFIVGKSKKINYVEGMGV